MRIAQVKYGDIPAGILIETDYGDYEFTYLESYVNSFPNQFVTFNMPVRRQPYTSKRLFPFFDGLIPEGWLLNIASENWKIKKDDRMGLLLATCKNCIGAVSVHQVTISTEGDE